MKIVTNPTGNPTPNRGWDWSAYDDDTLDVDSIQGLGATPEAAFADFLDVYEQKYGIRLEEKF
jgi:hypothetical protein